MALLPCGGPQSAPLYRSLHSEQPCSRSPRNRIFLLVLARGQSKQVINAEAAAKHLKSHSCWIKSAPTNAGYFISLALGRYHPGRDLSAHPAASCAWKAGCT